MGRPTHFEIPVDDPDRAEQFYSTVFGWSFNRYDGAPDYYSLADTGKGDPGINGALYQRGTDTPVILTMSVDSIEDAVAEVEGLGGRVVQAKTAIPTMGWYATCDDTEGNRIGLFTADPAAS